MALCALSIYFAIKVEQRRRTWRQHKGEIDIKSGAAVTLRGVLDGDELSVRHEKRVFVVRLLGVRAFSPTINEPGIAHLGAQAAEALRATLREKKLTLHFKEKKRDKHKRLLAYLHADGKDVGFELVRRGLSPTRTSAQELIRAGRVTVAGAPADKAARLVAHELLQRGALRGGELVFGQSHVTEEDDIVFRQFLVLRKRLQISTARAHVTESRMQQQTAHIHARIALQRIAQVAILPAREGFDHQHLELLLAD